MEDLEYNTRVKVLMEKLIPKETADGQETNELFLLYNLRLKPRETNKGCTGCRQRVFKRMKVYYESLSK